MPQEEDRHLDKETHRAQVRLANRALYAAERRLIAAHQEEFDRYYAEEAAARGFTPTGQNVRTSPERRAQAERQAEEQARARAERQRRRDFTGRVFGRLTVLGRGPNSEPTPAQPSGMVRWLCRCECGTEKLVRRDSLVKGHTRSCGCLARELGVPTYPPPAGV
jgi:hypothetical protein